MQFQPTLAFAQQLDEQDPLRAFRQQFIIPSANDVEKVYFLGNSLGLQPKRTKDKLQTILDDWGKLGVESFFHAEQPWMDYHDRLVGPLSKIVGCLPHEVTVMNNLSVNLHLMLVSFYRPKGKRIKILCEAKAFPSDQYMMETHVKHHGFDPADAIIEVTPRPGEHTIRNEDLLQIIVQHREELALVLFGGINYYSGQVFDMQTITQLAKQAGAKVGFDLAHAAGNIELKLHDWNVDFACWCNYKYLNSGPGAIAGAFIHSRHLGENHLPRLEGWWGNDVKNRFKMQPAFTPTATAESWSMSTSPVLLLAAHRASVEVFGAAGFDRLLAKSKSMSGYLFFVLNHIQQKNPKFSIITPQEPGRHGCQVSLSVHQNAKAVFDTLMPLGIFADWREPNVIRIAPVPLYNSYEEIFIFADILNQLL